MNDAVPIQAEDLAQIDGWSRQRGVMEDPDGWRPQLGYWVPGVLAAWLYRTDSKVALIDGVIANPDTSADQRRLAMRAVSDAIASKARSEGFRWLKGLTRFSTVAENGRDAGYFVSPSLYSTMLLVLA